MKNVKDIRILDETMLKIIAMISMVFDHVGDMFFPGVMWPRMIGRLAMPLFSFCIAEGYIHTRDRKKYTLRIRNGGSCISDQSGLYSLCCYCCFPVLCS